MKNMKKNKKRNPTFRIAFRGLGRRKKQTAIAVTGILFAVMFVTITALIGNSVILTSDKLLKDNYGEQNILISDYPATVEGSRALIYENSFKENPIIEKIGAMEISGFVTDKVGSNREYFVGYVSHEAAELAHINLAQGRLPQNDGEIALEESMLNLLGIDAKIGDEISINVNLHPDETEDEDTISQRSLLLEENDGRHCWYWKLMIEGALIYKREMQQYYGADIDCTPLDEYMQAQKAEMIEYAEYRIGEETAQRLDEEITFTYDWIGDSIEDWVERYNIYNRAASIHLTDAGTATYLYPLASAPESYVQEEIKGTLVGIVNNYSEMQSRSEGATNTRRISVFLDAETASQHWQSHTILLKYKPETTQQEVEVFEELLKDITIGVQVESPDHSPKIHLNSMIYENDGENQQTKTWSIVLGLLILLMIGGIMLIVNSFLISLKAKLRGLGLLRAVGAAKGQVRGIIFWEACLLMLITVPAGLASGTILSYLILEVVGAYIKSDMIFGFSWFLIGLSALMGVVSIAFGVIIPANKASRIPPIIAASGSTNENKKGKRAKKGKKKTMSPFKLALTSILQNKARILTAVMALVISVSVLNVVLTYINYTYATSPLFIEEKSVSISKLNLHEVDDGRFSGMRYHDEWSLVMPEDSYMNYAEKGILEGLDSETIEKIQNIEGVEKVEINRFTEYCYILADKDNLSEYERNLYLIQKGSDSFYGLINNVGMSSCEIPNEMWVYTDTLAEKIKSFDSTSPSLAYPIMKILEGKEIPNKGYSSQGKAAIQTNLMSMDEAGLRQLEKYVVEGSINIEKILSGEEVIISANPLALMSVQDIGVPTTNPMVKLVSPSVEKYEKMQPSYKVGDELNLVTIDEPSDTRYDWSEDMYIDADPAIYPTYRTNYFSFDDSYFADTPRSDEASVKVGAVISGYFADNTIISGNNLILEGLGLQEFEPSSLDLYLDMSMSVREAEEVINQIVNLRNDVIPDTHYMNNYYSALQGKKQIDSLRIYFSLICAAIAVIGFFSLLNTMTSRVGGARREISVLRAIGMTQNQLRKMFVYEGAMYGLLAVAIALAVSLAAAYIILGTVKYVSLAAMGACIVLCVLIGVISVLMSIRKIFKGSIIEGVSQTE